MKVRKSGEERAKNVKLSPNKPRSDRCAETRLNGHFRAVVQVF